MNGGVRECMICRRQFSNSRALGGHMKSHLAMFPLPLTSQRNQQVAQAPDVHKSQISSLADASPIEVHGKESHTDSIPIVAIQHKRQYVSEQVSSALDLSGVVMSGQVQIVAQPLPMLWGVELRRSKRNLKPADYKIPGLSDEEEDETDEEEGDVNEKYLMTGGQAIIIKSYRCKTCKKRFRSRKALDVHRVDHGRKRNLNPDGSSNENDCVAGPANGQVYRCQVCERVFKSARGPGGHKKVHLHKVPDLPGPKRMLMIDLNEPAPADDGDD